MEEEKRLTRQPDGKSLFQIPAADESEEDDNGGGGGGGGMQPPSYRFQPPDGFRPPGMRGNEQERFGGNLDYQDLNWG